MPFQLQAFVVVPDFSTDADGDPIRVFPPAKCQFVLIDTFPTLTKARKAATNTQRVFLNPPDNTILVSERQVAFFKIVEVP